MRDQRLTRRRARGFTMVELLVAGFLSAVVLISVYFVFTASSRQYYRQEQIVQMQEGMRFALEYLKTDLRNAGRLSVVNGQSTGLERDPGLCYQVRQRGVQLFDDEAGAGVPEVLRAAPNLVNPDRLRLLVDASGGSPLSTARIVGANVIANRGQEQGSRTARAVVNSQGRFEATFRVGDFLYLEATNAKQSDLIPITEVRHGASPTVTTSRPTCMGAGVCDGGGCMMVPVQLVEYAVAEDPEDAARTHLYRRVLNAQSPEDDPRSALILAEYVVDLQVWGTYDNHAIGQPPRVPVDANPSDDVGNWPEGASEAGRMNKSPERLRAMNLVLASRTPREDEEFRVSVGRAVPAGARVAADRTWFDLDDDLDTGLARVATLRVTVETPNLNTGM